MFKLYNGDCLEIMGKLIDTGTKVDMILTDLPYGTTNCKWDSVIPLNEMWLRLNKLVNKNTAICLFSDEPFTSNLIVSNIKKFKYRITWDKVVPSGFLNAKKMPLKEVEDICVFYEKLPIYNPQFTERTEDEKKIYKQKLPKGYKIEDRILDDSPYNKFKTEPEKDNVQGKYPTNLIRFNQRNNECNNRNRVHPTQKNINLLEYLIKTYTNEGDLVLDFTMGSGSTGVACMNTKRRFIGIELDKKYFDIAKERIESVKNG